MCLEVINPVYGTWFAVAYLKKQQNDVAITVGGIAEI